jgi:4-hydroxy-2-oxoheptanedioate aldolase
MTVTKNRRHVIGFLAALVAICTAPPHAAVQQSSSSNKKALRINTMIQTLEQGKVAESCSGVGKNLIGSADDCWTFIDMEHQPYDIVGLRAKFDEMGAKRKPNGQLASTPMVRIPMYGDESPRWAVKQVLDLGGLGITFPDVETREEALRAVRAMRYAPQRGSKYPEPAGRRGAGGMPPRLWPKLDFNQYIAKADVWPLNPDGELFAMVMVESAEGVKNVKEIASVPGVGALFIGPNDLSVSLGVGAQMGTTLAPENEVAIQKVADACKAHRVVCGIAATWATKEKRRQLISQGFRVLL